jgi:pimeloyl-ACP methyl ester carboxylesterase
MDIRQWQASGDRQTLLGHEIFTRVEPDTGKPPLLLIHGYPTACWDFETLWPALSDTFRLVSCDMLGFGFSAKPADHVYSIHQQADIIEALVSHVGLEEYHVLAHDYGDTVAQELLARQNSGNGIGSCLSMCFLNGGLFPETHRALAVQKLLLSPLGKWICRYSGQRSFNRSVSRVFGPDTKPDAVTLDQFWQLVCYNDGNRQLYRLINYMRDRIQHRERWVTALQQSRLPLALINGSADPVSGAHMVARYQQLACRLDYLAQLPGIGHWPQMEAADEVCRHYLAFIGGSNDTAAENAGEKKPGH